MLSRTASNLFWTGRYVERADFLARLLDATQRLAALPSSYGGDVSAWASALEAASVAEAYAARIGAVEEHAVSQYLTLDPNNPSSIRRCVEQARANARSVRTALTTEAWEAINTAWLDVRRYGVSLDSRPMFGDLVASVRTAVLAFEGAAQRTMMRHDAWWFITLGAAIERADNTARLLDVKYHLLLPKDEKVGGSLDYFQWTTILRTVSALTAYRHVYRDAVKPWLVADLLILNPRMPRSLSCCYEEIVRHLDLLAAQSGRRGPAHRMAAAASQRLSDARIEDIFASGLHEFIAAFIHDNNRLGGAIADQYLF